MKYLGIDYGTRRIGIAISDDDGRIAFPLKTIPAKNAVPVVTTLIEKNQIKGVVVGKSERSDGADNPIMKEIEKFIENLVAAISVSVFYEKEAYTSFEAAQQGHQKPTARKPKSPLTHRDESAAALILQRFLEKKV